MKLDLVRLISWDLDGTLYSISRMKWHLLGLFLREIGAGRGLQAGQALEALRRFRARIDTARSAGGDLGSAWNEYPDREALLDVETRWYGAAIEQIGPRPGVVGLLSFFEERNISQVLFSDYHAEYKLSSLGLEERFTRVYVGEQLGFVKPSPKVLERIAVDFGVPIENLLHIGDRVDRDEAAARAAGCQCWILGRDFPSFPSLLNELRAGV
ncbi:MAG: HAD family hydrolase [Pyrinomonadaceae bacterium]